MERRRCVGGAARHFGHVPGPISNVLRCCGLSARATATLATGEAAERCRLPREPGPGPARLGAGPSRPLARVSAHPPTASAIARQREGGNPTGGARPVCKDGRVKIVSPRALRDSPDRAGDGRGVCKDGRVDRGNDFDIKAIRGGGGGLQREDVIGVPRRRQCARSDRPESCDPYRCA